MRRTRYRIPRSSFLHGMAHTLDIGATLNPIGCNPESTAQKSIAADWRTVCEDMQRAMNTVGRTMGQRVSR